MPVRSVCSEQTEAADVKLDCPAVWTDGVSEVLTCFLNTTTFSPSTCQKAFLDLVDFQFLASGGSQHSSECTVEDVTTCDGSFSNKNCRCREVWDGQYVLEYIVTGRRDTQEGGTWKCVPGCFDAHLQNPFKYPPYAKSLQCEVPFGEYQQQLTKSL